MLSWRLPDQSAFAPEIFTTLAHVSSAMNLPKSADEPAKTVDEVGLGMLL
jgi:hypothetical protein